MNSATTNDPSAARVQVKNPPIVGTEELQRPFRFTPSRPSVAKPVPPTKMKRKSSRKATHTSSLTEFDFEAPAARQVSLAGDFNNWDANALPLQKGPDGFWRVSVPLKPGRYEYRFYVDGVWQDDPFAQQRVANPLGSQNCVKIVV